MEEMYLKRARVTRRWLRGGEEFNCMREKGEVGVSAGAEGEEKKKTGKERGRKERQKNRMLPCLFCLLLTLPATQARVHAQVFNFHLTLLRTGTKY